VCARRLARHSLLEPATDIASVAGAMCGVHAQVMNAAEVSVGIRVPGVTGDHVRDALWHKRTLVKTYGPRGTVHLFPAEELPVWAAAFVSAGRMTSGDPRARMTSEQTDAVVAALAEALAGGEAMTVEELDTAVVGATGAWAADRVIPAFGDTWPRWRSGIHVAAYRGVLCFGPNRGRVTTYAGVRGWVPDYVAPPGPGALAAVVRRYLGAYGPATPDQFGQWIGMARPEARALFERFGDALVEVDVEGQRAWLVAGDETVPDGVPEVRLLPYFDAYTVGCHPRERVFPGVAHQRAVTNGGAGNVPVVLVDGEVAGVWHQRKSGRRLAVTVEAFGRLTARHRRELDEQAARIAEIQGAEATLTLGPVTAGRHL